MINDYFCTQLSALVFTDVKTANNSMTLVIYERRIASEFYEKYVTCYINTIF